MTDVTEAVPVPLTTRKDWSSDQEVRWCPGCGDYSILAAVQMLMPDLGVRRESSVFLSGIGCAARFPYYMNTYGMHSIHGRAPAIATGLGQKMELTAAVTRAHNYVQQTIAARLHLGKGHPVLNHLPAP